MTTRIIEFTLRVEYDRGGEVLVEELCRAAAEMVPGVRLARVIGGSVREIEPPITDGDIVTWAKGATAWRVLSPLPDVKGLVPLMYVGDINDGTIEPVGDTPAYRTEMLAELRRVKL